MTDDQFYQAQTRNLEREVRVLRRNLRDQFAMAALTGLLANPAYSKMDVDEFVDDAWLYADAMLAARTTSKTST